MEKISEKFYFIDLPYIHGFFSISLLASQPLAERQGMGEQEKRETTGRQSSPGGSAQSTPAQAPLGGSRANT